MTQVVIFGDFQLSSTVTRRTVIQGGFDLTYNSNTYSNDGLVVSIGSTRTALEIGNITQTVVFFIDDDVRDAMRDSTYRNRTATIYKGEWDANSGQLTNVNIVKEGFFDTHNIPEEDGTVEFIVSGFLARTQKAPEGIALQSVHNTRLRRGDLGDGTNGNPDNRNVTDLVFENAGKSYTDVTLGDFKYIDAIIEKQVIGKAKRSVFGGHYNIYGDVQVRPALEGRTGSQIDGAGAEFQPAKVYGKSLVEDSIIAAWNPSKSAIDSNYRLSSIRNSGGEVTASSQTGIRLPIGSVIKRGSEIKTESGNTVYAVTTNSGKVISNAAWYASSSSFTVYAGSGVSTSNTLRQNQGSNWAENLAAWGFGSGNSITSATVSYPFSASGTTYTNNNRRGSTWRGDALPEELEGINGDSRYVTMVHLVHTGTPDTIEIHFDGLRGTKGEGEEETDLPSDVSVSFAKPSTISPNTVSTHKILDGENYVNAVIEVQWGALNQRVNSRLAGTSRGTWDSDNKAIGYAIVAITYEATRSGRIQSFPTASFVVENNTLRNWSEPTITTSETEDLGSFDYEADINDVEEGEFTSFNGVVTETAFSSVTSWPSFNGTFRIRPSSTIADALRTHAFGTTSNTVGMIAYADSDRDIEVLKISNTMGTGYLRVTNIKETTAGVFYITTSGYLNSLSSGIFVPADGESFDLALHRIDGASGVERPSALSGEVRSNEFALVLVNYLTDKLTGPGIELDNIDIGSFYDAFQRASRVPKKCNGVVQNRGQYTEYLEDFFLSSGISVYEENGVVKARYRKIINQDDISVTFDDTNTEQIKQKNFRVEDKYNEFLLTINEHLNESRKAPRNTKRTFTVNNDNYVDEDNSTRNQGKADAAFLSTFYVEAAGFQEDDNAATNDSADVIEDTRNNAEQKTTYEDYASFLMDVSRYLEEVEVETDYDTAKDLKIGDAFLCVKDLYGWTTSNPFVFEVVEIEDDHNGNVTIIGQRHSNEIFGVADDFAGLFPDSPDPYILPYTGIDAGVQLASVTDLAITDLEPNASPPSFRLSWTVPSSGSPITGWDIYEDDEDGDPANGGRLINSLSQPNGYAGGTTVTAQILNAPATKHTYWIVARNGRFAGDPSNSFLVDWRSSGPPGTTNYYADIRNSDISATPSSDSTKENTPVNTTNNPNGLYNQNNTLVTADKLTSSDKRDRTVTLIINGTRTDVEVGEILPQSEGGGTTPAGAFISTTGAPISIPPSFPWTPPEEYDSNIQYTHVVRGYRLGGRAPSSVVNLDTNTGSSKQHWDQVFTGEIAELPTSSEDEIEVTFPTTFNTGGRDYEIDLDGLNTVATLANHGDSQTFTAVGNTGITVVVSSADADDPGDPDTGMRTLTYTISNVPDGAVFTFGASTESLNQEDYFHPVGDPDRIRSLEVTIADTDAVPGWTLTGTLISPTAEGSLVEEANIVATTSNFTSSLIANRTWTKVTDPSTLSFTGFDPADATASETPSSDTSAYTYNDGTNDWYIWRRDRTGTTDGGWHISRTNASDARWAFDSNSANPSTVEEPDRANSWHIVSAANTAAALSAGTITSTAEDDAEITVSNRFLNLNNLEIDLVGAFEDITRVSEVTTSSDSNSTITAISEASGDVAEDAATVTVRSTYAAEDTIAFTDFTASVTSTDIRGVAGLNVTVAQDGSDHTYTLAGVPTGSTLTLTVGTDTLLNNGVLRRANQGSAETYTLTGHLLVKDSEGTTHTDSSFNAEPTTGSSGELETQAEISYDAVDSGSVEVTFNSVAYAEGLREAIEGTTDYRHVRFFDGTNTTATFSATAADLSATRDGTTVTITGTGLTATPTSVAVGSEILADQARGNTTATAPADNAADTELTTFVTMIKNIGGFIGLDLTADTAAASAFSDTVTTPVANRAQATDAIETFTAANTTDVTSPDWDAGFARRVATRDDAIFISTHNQGATVDGVSHASNAGVISVYNWNDGTNDWEQGTSIVAETNGDTAGRGGTANRAPLIGVSALDVRGEWLAFSRKASELHQYVNTSGVSTHNQNEDSVEIWRRDAMGDWAFHSEIFPNVATTPYLNGYFSFRSSGLDQGMLFSPDATRLAIYDSLQQDVIIWRFDGTNWVTEQTIDVGASSNIHLQFTNDTLYVALRRNNLRIYERSGTTWTLLQTQDFSTTYTFGRINFRQEWAASDLRITFFEDGKSNLYTFERADTSSTYDFSSPVETAVTTTLMPGLGGSTASNVQVHGNDDLTTMQIFWAGNTSGPAQAYYLEWNDTSDEWEVIGRNVVDDDLATRGSGGTAFDGLTGIVQYRPSGPTVNTVVATRGVAEQYSYELSNRTTTSFSNNVTLTFNDGETDEEEVSGTLAANTGMLTAITYATAAARTWKVDLGSRTTASGNTQYTLDLLGDYDFQNSDAVQTWDADFSGTIGNAGTATFEELTIDTASTFDTGIPNRDIGTQTGTPDETATTTPASSVNAETTTAITGGFSYNNIGSTAIDLEVTTVAGETTYTLSDVPAGSDIDLVVGGQTLTERNLSHTFNDTDATRSWSLTGTVPVNDTEGTLAANGEISAVTSGDGTRVSGTSVTGIAGFSGLNLSAVIVDSGVTLPQTAGGLRADVTVTRAANPFHTATETVNTWALYAISINGVDIPHPPATAFTGTTPQLPTIGEHSGAYIIDRVSTGSPLNTYSQLRFVHEAGALRTTRTRKVSETVNPRVAAGVATTFRMRFNELDIGSDEYARALGIASDATYTLTNGSSEAFDSVTFTVDGNNSIGTALSGASTTLSAAETAMQTVLSVTAADDFIVGEQVNIAGNIYQITAKDDAADTITIDPALEADAASGVDVTSTAVVGPLTLGDIDDGDTWSISFGDTSFMDLTFGSNVITNQKLPGGLDSTEFPEWLAEFVNSQNWDNVEATVDSSDNTIVRIKETRTAENLTTSFSLTDTASTATLENTDWTQSSVDGNGGTAADTRATIEIEYDEYNSSGSTLVATRSETFYPSAGSAEDVLDEVVAESILGDYLVSSEADSDTLRMRNATGNDSNNIAGDLRITYTKSSADTTGDFAIATPSYTAENVGLQQGRRRIYSDGTITQEGAPSDWTLDVVEKEGERIRYTVTNNSTTVYPNFNLETGSTDPGGTDRIGGTSGTYLQTNADTVVDVFDTAYTTPALFEEHLDWHIEYGLTEPSTWTMDFTPAFFTTYLASDDSTNPLEDVLGLSGLDTWVDITDSSNSTINVRNQTGNDIEGVVVKYVGSTSGNTQDFTATDIANGSTATFAVTQTNQDSGDYYTISIPHTDEYYEDIVFPANLDASETASYLADYINHNLNDIDNTIPTADIISAEVDEDNDRIVHISTSNNVITTGLEFSVTEKAIYSPSSTTTDYWGYKDATTREAANDGTYPTATTYALKSPSSATTATIQWNGTEIATNVTFTDLTGDGYEVDGFRYFASSTAFDPDPVVAADDAWYPIRRESIVTPDNLANTVTAASTVVQPFVHLVFQQRDKSGTATTSVNKTITIDTVGETSVIVDNIANKIPVEGGAFQYILEGTAHTSDTLRINTYGGDPSRRVTRNENVMRRTGYEGVNVSGDLTVEFSLGGANTDLNSGNTLALGSLTFTGGTTKDQLRVFVYEPAVDNDGKEVTLRNTLIEQVNSNLSSTGLRDQLVRMLDIGDDGSLSDDGNTEYSGNDQEAHESSSVYYHPFLIDENSITLNGTIAQDEIIPLGWNSLYDVPEEAADDTDQYGSTYTEPGEDDGVVIRVYDGQESNVVDAVAIRTDNQYVVGDIVITEVLVDSTVQGPANWDYEKETNLSNSYVTFTTGNIPTSGTITVKGYTRITETSGGSDEDILFTAGTGGTGGALTLSYSNVTYGQDFNFTISGEPVSLLNPGRYDSATRGAVASLPST